MKLRRLLLAIAACSLIGSSLESKVSAKLNSGIENEEECYYELDENGKLIKICETASPTGTEPDCIGECWY